MGVDCGRGLLSLLWLVVGMGRRAWGVGLLSGRAVPLAIIYGVVIRLGLGDLEIAGFGSVVHRAFAGGDGVLYMQNLTCIISIVARARSRHS